MKNKKFKELLKTPVELCEKDIPFVDGYGNKICYYANTERQYKPYINTKTWGKNNFDDFVALLKKLKVKRVLDLGCGAGEMLHKIGKSQKNTELYGITIDLGEVDFARDVYGLKNVVPIDMREIEDYFDKNYFDAVVVWCAFQYFTIEEKMDICRQAGKLIKPGGYFFDVQYEGYHNGIYKDTTSTGYPSEWEGDLIRRKDLEDIKTQGGFFAFQKQ